LKVDIKFMKYACSYPTKYSYNFMQACNKLLIEKKAGESYALTIYFYSL